MDSIHESKQSDLLKVPAGELINSTNEICHMTREKSKVPSKKMEKRNLGRTAFARLYADQWERMNSIRMSPEELIRQALDMYFENGDIPNSSLLDRKFIKQEK